MKKLLTLTISLLFVGIIFGQDMFWAVYHFEVKPGQDAEVAAAFDKFFTSETGKKLPYASLGSNLFSSSGDQWTHEIVFATQSKEQFGEMYSGMLQQSLDYALLSQSMDKSIKGVASYLGKMLVGEPIPGNNYATVYELSVSDPAAYAAAFKKMREGLMAKTGGKMGLDLHQFISGNEPGATHVAVANAPSFKDLLDFTDIVFSSDEYATFAKEVNDVRKILRVFTTFTMQEWNMPDGM